MTYADDLVIISDVPPGGLCQEEKLGSSNVLSVVQHLLQTLGAFKVCTVHENSTPCSYILTAYHRVKFRPDLIGWKW